MSDTTGVQVTPYDPNIGLKTLQGWQALRNARASNALTQQQTLNAQQENTNLQTTNTGMLQEQAMKRYEKNASAMYAVSGLPDDQFGPALGRMLDAELQSGLMKPEEAQLWKSKLDQATANKNYGGLRQDIIGGIIRNAPTPEAAARAVQGAQHAGYGAAGNGSGITPLPGPDNVDTGAEIVPTSGGQRIGPGLTKEIAPQLTNTQGGVVPTSRGAPTGPVIPYTLSPNEAVKPETRPVWNQETGSWDLVTKNAGEWNPAANAPIVKGGGQGGPLGKGSYTPPQSAMPMGTEKQLASNQEDYQSELKTVAPLQTGTQSLQKALKALNLVSTGAGTEGLAAARAYAVSLGNVLGVDTGGINVQDMDTARLNKYLTDYARQAAKGQGTNLDQQLSAESNASGHINNSAAQDVVRTNIGRDRQKIAAILDQQRLNPEGANYGPNKANVMLTTDPRGFAWDSYTNSQKDKILKDVGPKGSPGYRKLSKAIGMAETYHLNDPSFHLPENVNTSPDSSSSAIPTMQQLQNADAATRARMNGNLLTNPPPNSLSRFGD